jgi:hypothetical protein
MGNEAKDFKRLFPQGHIPIILSSIFQAGSTVKKKKAQDREDWITRRLYSRLKTIPVYRDGPLDIRMQTEISSSDVDSNYPAGRIDVLVACGMGVEVYFAIEAKRLRVRSSKGKLVLGNRGYVVAGMMRFVTGQYAPYMEAGAMLGYVYDGKTDHARSDVDNIVQNNELELKLKPPKQLKQSNILLDGSVSETHHKLSQGRSFTIYHAFLAI